MIGQAKDDDDIRIEALLQRGVLYEHAGDKEAAIGDYSEVIKLDPSSAVAYFNRGNVYDQMGEHDRAIADYTEAIKLDPTDPDVVQQPRPGLRHQGRARPGDRRLFAVDPPRAATIRAPSTIAAWPMPTRASTQRAIADFDEAIKLDPRDAEAYVSRGAVNEELGNEAAATADYRKALADRCPSTTTQRRRWRASAIE